MEDDLPKEFDLIVIGTGFSESVVAAAASRIGKTVLHLDPNDFYGGVWASFNLEALQKYIENISNSKDADTLTLGEIQAAKQKWYIEEKIPENQASIEARENSEVETAPSPTPLSAEEAVEVLPDWTREKILKEFRKFNIDLSPKLLFSTGKMVDLLITSNICRYAEFRAVDRICTLMNEQVKNVPCSRSDVFNTKDVHIVEKRLLMKLLTNCMSYDEHPENFVDFQDKTFLEYLQSNKLTDNIIHFVLYAISMSNEQTTMRDGMERTKNFLSSLGRYGNTPFLFPMYGCGEIPQCFCRLCAVFGGIYCLKRPIRSIETEEETGVKELRSVTCGNQKISVKNLVIGSGSIRKELLQLSNAVEHSSNICGNLARGIFITTSPLGDEELNSGGGGVNLLKFPGQNVSKGAILIQLSHYSGCCPKGLYIIHITCESSSDDPEADLEPYLSKVFKNSPSTAILYSVFFKISNCAVCGCCPDNALPKNIDVTCGPFFELDYDLSIENARKIFNKIYPEEAFLPRAPDPEDIVIGDEDSAGIGTDDNVNLSDQIKEIQEGIENAAICIEENSRNEEMDTPTADEAKELVQS